MPMRVSITIDPDTMDLVDKFAKEHGLDRNRAILECIETGYARLTDGTPVTFTQTRTFEEYNDLRQAISEVKSGLSTLAEEVRLMHHTIEVEWNREIRGVPYQSRKWYEFWKT
ncbi:MAG: type II secretion system protein E [Methanolinea sp.]|jgi:hypothetical protein|nr:type II secretion system protein E [Methanolinea sp.]